MKALSYLKISVGVVLVLGAFSFILYKAFFAWDRVQEEKQMTKNRTVARLSPEQMASLQEGDIILRRGYGFFSNMIAEHLNDSVFDVTHCGILYQEDKEWHVIHSLSTDVSEVDGVQSQSLKEFLLYSYPQKLLITSPKGISSTQRKQMVGRAKYYLEQKVPFDHTGNIDEPSELYCTELVWQILEKDLGLLSLPSTYDERKQLFFSMKGMYSPLYFDIIINTYPSK